MFDEENSACILPTMDRTAPELEDFTLSPSTFDPRFLPATVVMHLEITDDESGFDHGLVIASLGPEDRALLTMEHNATSSGLSFDMSDHTGGTNLTPIFDLAFVFPETSVEGTYHISINLADQTGNERFLDPDALDAMTFVSAIIAEPDEMPPTLKEFVVKGNEINTYTSDDSIEIRVVIEDEGSGFDFGIITATHESVTGRRELAETTIDGGVISLRFNESDRTGGTDEEPEFELNMTFPEGSPPGEYAIALELTDKAGNTEDLTTQELVDEHDCSCYVVGKEDIESPELVNLTALSPLNVDLSSGDQSVALQVEFQDDLSGIEYAYVSAYFEDESGWNSAGEWCYMEGGPVAGVPVSCDVELVFEQNFRNGNYSLSVILYDEVDNSGSYDAEDLEAKGFPSYITVENGNPDITPPELLSLTALSPLTIDTSESDQSVSLQVEFQDDLSGIEYAYVSAYFEDESGWNSAGEWCYMEGGPVAGVPVSCDVELVFEQNFRNGNYSLSVILYDAVDNSGSYDAEDLEALGFPSYVTVENGNPDITPPELLSLTALSPLTIDTSESDQSVSLQVEFQDDLSGIEYAYVSAYFEDESGWNSAGEWCYMEGGPVAGVPVSCDVELVFEQYFRDGNYSLSVILYDAVDNSGSYDAEDLEALGFPSYVTNEFGA